MTMCDVFLELMLTIVARLTEYEQRREVEDVVVHPRYNSGTNKLELITLSVLMKILCNLSSPPTKTTNINITIQQERHCTIESEKRLQLHWTTSLSCMSSHKVKKERLHKNRGKTDRLKFDADLEATKVSACLSQRTNLQGWRLLWLEKGNLAPSFSPFSITFSLSLSFYPKPWSWRV